MTDTTPGMAAGPAVALAVGGPWVAQWSTGNRAHVVRRTVGTGAETLTSTDGTTRKFFTSSEAEAAAVEANANSERITP